MAKDNLEIKKEESALDAIRIGIIDRLTTISNRAKKSSCPKELIDDIDEAKCALAISSERIKIAQEDLEYGADTILEISNNLNSINEVNIKSFKDAIESKLGKSDEMKLFQEELDLSKNIACADAIVQQQNLAIQLLRRREESCINVLHNVSKIFEAGLSNKSDSSELWDRKNIVENLKSLANRINEDKNIIYEIDKSKSPKINYIEPIINRLSEIKTYFNNKNHVVCFKIPEEFPTNVDDYDDSSSGNDMSYLQLLLTKGITTAYLQNGDKDGRPNANNDTYPQLYTHSETKSDTTSSSLTYKEEDIEDQDENNKSKSPDDLNNASKSSNYVNNASKSSNYVNNASKSPNYVNNTSKGPNDLNNTSKTVHPNDLNNDRTKESDIIEHKNETTESFPPNSTAFLSIKNIFSDANTRYHMRENPENHSKQTDLNIKKKDKDISPKYFNESSNNTENDESSESVRETDEGVGIKFSLYSQDNDKNAALNVQSDLKEDKKTNLDTNQHDENSPGNTHSDDVTHKDHSDEVNNYKPAIYDLNSDAKTDTNSSSTQNNVKPSINSGSKNSGYGDLSGSSSHSGNSARSASCSTDISPSSQGANSNAYIETASISISSKDFEKPERVQQDERHVLDKNDKGSKNDANYVEEKDIISTGDKKDSKSYLTSSENIQFPISSDNVPFNKSPTTSKISTFSDFRSPSASILSSIKSNHRDLSPSEPHAVTSIPNSIPHFDPNLPNINTPVDQKIQSSPTTDAASQDVHTTDNNDSSVSVVFSRDEQEDHISSVNTPIETKKSSSNSSDSKTTSTDHESDIVNQEEPHETPATLNKCVSESLSPTICEENKNADVSDKHNSISKTNSDSNGHAESNDKDVETAPTNINSALNDKFSYQKPEENFEHSRNIGGKQSLSHEPYFRDNKFIDEAFKTESSSKEYYSAKSNKSAYEQSIKSSKYDEDNIKEPSQNNNNNSSFINPKPSEEKVHLAENSFEKHDENTTHIKPNNFAHSEDNKREAVNNAESDDQSTFDKDRVSLMKRFVDTNISKEYPGLFTGFGNSKAPSLEPPEVLELLNIYRAQVSIAVTERDKSNEMVNELRRKVEMLEKSIEENESLKLNSEENKSKKQEVSYQRNSKETPDENLEISTKHAKDINSVFENSEYDHQQLSEVVNDPNTEKSISSVSMKNFSSVNVFSSIDNDKSFGNVKEVELQSNKTHSPDSEPLISQLIHKDKCMIEKRSTIDLTKSDSVRASKLLESILNKSRNFSNSTDHSEIYGVSNSKHESDIISKLKSHREFNIFFKILIDQFEQLDQKITDQSEVLKLKNEEIEFLKKSLGPGQENIFAHHKALELQVESLLKRLVDVEYELTKSNSEVKESREALEILEGCLLIEREKNSHLSTKLDALTSKNHHNLIFDVKNMHFKGDMSDNKSSIATMKFNDDEVSIYKRMMDYAKHPKKYSLELPSDNSSLFSYPEVQTSVPKLIIDRDIRGIKRKKLRKEIHSGLRKQSLGWKEYLKKEFGKSHTSSELENYFSYSTTGSDYKLQGTPGIKNNLVKDTFNTELEH